MCFIWTQHIATPNTGDILFTYGLLLPYYFHIIIEQVACLLRFPPQEDVVSFVVRISRNFLAKQPKALIVVGAYSIGKEQVYLAISRALGVGMMVLALKHSSSFVVCVPSSTFCMIFL